MLQINKRNTIITKVYAFVCAFKQNHTPTLRATRRRGAAAGDCSIKQGANPVSSRRIKSQKCLRYSSLLYAVAITGLPLGDASLYHDLRAALYIVLPFQALFRPAQFGVLTFQGINRSFALCSGFWFPSFSILKAVQILIDYPPPMRHGMPRQLRVQRAEERTASEPSLRPTDLLQRNERT